MQKWFGNVRVFRPQCQFASGSSEQLKQPGELDTAIHLIDSELYRTLEHKVSCFSATNIIMW